MLADTIQIPTWIDSGLVITTLTAFIWTLRKFERMAFRQEQLEATMNTLIKDAEHLTEAVNRLDKHFALAEQREEFRAEFTPPPFPVPHRVREPTREFKVKKRPPQHDDDDET